MKIICDNCGAENKKSAKYCHMCYKKLEKTKKGKREDSQSDIVTRKINSSEISVNTTRLFNDNRDLDVKRSTSDTEISAFEEKRDSINIDAFCPMISVPVKNVDAKEANSLPIINNIKNEENLENNLFVDVGNSEHKTEKRDAGSEKTEKRDAGSENHMGQPEIIQSSNAKNQTAKKGPRPVRVPIKINQNKKPEQLSSVVQEKTEKICITPKNHITETLQQPQEEIKAPTENDLNTSSEDKSLIMPKTASKPAEDPEPPVATKPVFDLSGLSFRDLKKEQQIKEKKRQSISSHDISPAVVVENLKNGFYAKIIENGNNTFVLPNGTVLKKQENNNYLDKIEYDGYYDDVLPVDFNNEENIRGETIDSEMAKKIIVIIAAAFAAIGVSVLSIMYL